MAATAMVETWRRASCHRHGLISSRHYHEKCTAITRRMFANRSDITSVMDRSITDKTPTNGNEHANNDITPLKTATLAFKQRRKRSSLARRNMFVSTYSHPKSYTPLPSSTYKLTRKDILRLTPHQRAIVHKHRHTEYINSLSHLDRARINVRSNVRYLKDKANVGTNLENNIRTLKNLFLGKAKEGEGVTQPQNKMRSSSKAEDVEEVGIDWERAPDEIKANIRSNLSILQNWIHKVTDGRIPLAATAATNVSSSGDNVAGSVANRIRAFHEMKQNQPLIMDNWWIGKNILIALLPGAVLHVYFLSLQDEMKVYFARYEQVEREKLGLGSRSLDGGEEKKGVSIISALKPNDEESAWDKMKNVVDDLLFGGAERRIHELQQQAAQQQSRTKDDDELKKAEVSRMKEVDESKNASTLNLNDSSTVNEIKPDIQTLLSRIEALEKQLGNNNSNGMTSLSDNELRQRQEKERRRLERMQQHQSPIQNRRDASLRAKFNEIDSRNNNVQTINEEDSDNNDATTYFQYLAQFVSMEIATKTINHIRSMIGLSGEVKIDDNIITMVGVDAVDNKCRSDEQTMVITDNSPSINVSDVNEASNEVSRIGRIYRWVSSKWRIPKSSQSDDIDVDGMGK